MRIKIAKGISDDGHAYVVRAFHGSGDRLLESVIRVPKTRPLAEMLPELRAVWHREKMKLADAYAKAGGPVGRGTVAHDVDRYFTIKTFERRQLEDERRHQLAWWVKRFGHRTREQLFQQPNDLRRALNTLPLSPSTRNKYRTALSNVYTVLDGKNAANPFRDVVRDKEPDAERRDQPYELIDAIIANLRDRGRGHAVSKTKARIMVLAFAPVTPAQLWTLTRDCVDFDAGILYAPGRHKGTGTRGQGKPLTPDAVAAFRQFDAAGCWGLKASRSSIWRTFVRARDAAIAELKVTRPDLDLSRAAAMRPYDLRHSFATVVLRATRNLEATAAYLDHQDTKTTLRYAQAAMSAVLESSGAAVAAAFASRPVRIDSPTKLSNTDPGTPGNIRENVDISGQAKGRISTDAAPRLVRKARNA